MIILLLHQCIAVSQIVVLDDLGKKQFFVVFTTNVHNTKSYVSNIHLSWLTLWFSGSFAGGNRPHCIERDKAAVASSRSSRGQAPWLVTPLV